MKEPPMDLRTLLQLTIIAANPDTRMLRWQPMPDHAIGKYYETQTLSLNNICERCVPYMTTINGWRNELTAKQRELDRAKDRIAHLERVVGIYFDSEVGDENA